MPLPKLKLKAELRLMIPRLAKEANQLKDPEARSRWMNLRKIALSVKSTDQACAHAGVSADWFRKWGKKLIKSRRLSGLFTKSRKPHRSPHKTRRRIEKQILKIRRVEPYLGPERIADTAEKLFNLSVAPSTIFAILRRAKLVGKKIAEKLTKKHLKRYRRQLPGYLQMDFKYVPYLIEGKQFYQLSCVDHHSGWRLIRNYRQKSTFYVMKFLEELKELCPFFIIEIQTDNDTAFTDKFSSQRGVTDTHLVDVWCKANEIIHRLIPVGVKELNGKVENTHKQDDREFFAMNIFSTYESIALSTKGYSDRWNTQRATKALGWLTPAQAIEQAYVKAIAMMMFIKKEGDVSVYKLDQHGDAVMTVHMPSSRLPTAKPKLDHSKLSQLSQGIKKEPKFQNFGSKSFIGLSTTIKSPLGIDTEFDG